MHYLRITCFALFSILHASADGNLRREDLPLSEIESHKDFLRLRELFNDWKIKTDKTYESTEEELKRLLVWIQNHEIIESHNQKNLSFKLGHNHFSDLTNEEYKRLNKLGPYFPSTVVKRSKVFDENSESAVLRKLEEEKLEKLPSELDWRAEGAVTDVKDQGACGSCWSFSTTGAIEGANFIKTGNLVPLSEQMFVDCDPVDLGCNGGLMDNAFQWEEDNGGLCSEDDYPYQAIQDVCKKDTCSIVPGSRIENFTDVKPDSVYALKTTVVQQPVAIAIEADTVAFQLYSSGVFNDMTCGVQLDHAVLLVGYGTDEVDGAYWIVKNSWSEAWGDEGYIKIAMKADNDEGICGILSLPSFPVLA